MVAWIVVVEKRQTTQELTKSEITHQFGQKDCREGFIFIFTSSNSKSNSELQFGAHLHFYSLCFLYFDFHKQQSFRETKQSSLHTQLILSFYNIFPSWVTRDICALVDENAEIP